MGVALGISSKSLATLLLVARATPAVGFDVRPNPNLTSDSVRIDGHDALTDRFLLACIGQTVAAAAANSSPAPYSTAARRAAVLGKASFSPGHSAERLTG